jgi:hypothetical protein
LSCSGYESNRIKQKISKRTVTKIEKDPFKYKMYTDTPPTTPNMSTMKSAGNILTNSCVANCLWEKLKHNRGSIRYKLKITSTYSNGLLILYKYRQLLKAVNHKCSKKHILKIEPANDNLYRYGHCTNQQIYEQVQKRLPNPHTTCSIFQFAHW